MLLKLVQSYYLYWTTIYELPSHATKQIESIFARYLWAGPDLSKKMHLVKWDHVCKPYEEGGLNVRRVKDMSTAGVMKLIWWIAAKKKNSLWVRWVHSKYLKQESFWTVKVPADCS